MITDYKILEELGMGTFSTVLKVEHIRDGKKYAMKRFKKAYKTMNEVNACSEIKVLRKLNPHKNIVNLYEVVFEHTAGLLCLTFELMECNLYELLSRENYRITEPVAKDYTFQICTALEYIHSLGIFHRDIKPENILISHDIIKLADFGSCRPINSEPPFTEYIATRWYRSPECILAEGAYNYKMDMWAVGCVLGEMLSKEALFPGEDEFDQIKKIHDIMGTPSDVIVGRMFTLKGIQPNIVFHRQTGRGLESLLPNVTRNCMSFIKLLLMYDPDERLSAGAALSHVFFSNRPTRIPSARASKLQKTAKTNFTLPHIKTLDIGSSAGQYNTTAPIPHFSTLSSHAPKLNKKAHHPHYYANSLPPIPVDKSGYMHEKRQPIYMSNTQQPVFKSYPPAPPVEYTVRKKALKMDRSLALKEKEDVKLAVPLTKKLSLPKIQGHASLYGKIQKDGSNPYPAEPSISFSRKYV